MCQVCNYLSKKEVLHRQTAMEEQSMAERFRFDNPPEFERIAVKAQKAWTQLGDIKTVLAEHKRVYHLGGSVKW